jgi:hypothetical protein
LNHDDVCIATSYIEQIVISGQGLVESRQCLSKEWCSSLTFEDLLPRVPENSQVMSMAGCWSNMLSYFKKQ